MGTFLIAIQRVNGTSVGIVCSWSALPVANCARARGERSASAMSATTVNPGPELRPRVCLLICRGPWPPPYLLHKCSTVGAYDLWLKTCNDTLINCYNGYIWRPRADSGAQIPPVLLKYV